VVTAAECALDRRLKRPSVALTSTNGGFGKITCFVFDAGQEEPGVVVKAMADRRRGEWLARENRLLEAIRARLDGTEAAAALSQAPIFAGWVGQDYFSVEAVDPQATSGERFSATASLRWLSLFIGATSLGRRPWSPQDRAVAGQVVSRAWQLYRPQRAHAITVGLSRRADAVRKADLVRCASHGDFWRGNIGCSGSLRVFDWEWASLDSDPTIDHWTFELAELRGLAMNPKALPEIHDKLGAALKRVETRLASAGIAPEFARLSLAPVLAHLTTRLGMIEGRTNGWQSAAPTLLAAAEPYIEPPLPAKRRTREAAR
jgi:hypothetical protein